ncbi:hypothetical protein FACS18942_07660 [Planctomycetales bacterium]|nr:hypothetical protein FACS18942_07660 [Planctomycetales bacterium]GHT34952.1 hypothetical protein FACS189427_03240 [Planctomycetales bacterium]
MTDYRIAIIFDLLYGEKLLKLAERMYVWAIYSPTNVKFANQIWNQSSNYSEFNISIMGNEKIQPVFNTDWLDTIWNHHYDNCGNPVISEILVIGVDLLPSVRKMLDDYGLDIVEESEEYFVARDREQDSQMIKN